MGSGKRAHRRQGKPQTQLRPRTTRSKGKLLSLSDPTENTQLLTEQLRSLGLYAAPTLGDGNCLFRALSDQMYGSPSRHAQLRQEICDWIQRYKSRYEPFVDDERGLDVHLQCMRQNATYGGHLELSAFAHMTKRNVKVIQPGLVYVIEWSAGWDASNDEDDGERRRPRRDKKRGKFPQDDIDTDDETTASTVYVAYHDWEHFSSIRNLKGPHAGLPNIQELPVDDIPAPPSPPAPKRLPKVKLKIAKPNNATSTTIGIHPPTPLEPPLPEQLPLPPSRSCSPTLSSPSPPPQPCPYPLPSTLSHDSLRVHRSPKRSFDESSAGSGSGSESAAKRTRSRLASPSHVFTNDDDDDQDKMDEDDADADADTPDLSAPGSSSSSSPPDSVASSLASSPFPIHGPEHTPVTPSQPPTQRLTRRQRKALGLPKPRAAFADQSRSSQSGAGTIVIPGGRYKASGAKKVVRVINSEERGVGEADEDDEGDEGNAEWRRNGTGRVDVRGFRELKI